MKNQKVLLILIVAFGVLLSAAYLLYVNLSADYEPEQIGPQVQSSTSQEPHDNEPGNSSHGGQESEDESKETDAQKTAAPDFTVYDAAGNAVKLSDYFGKPIVLNFWASWCGPCKNEMPEFHEKYLDLGDDIVFLMVNMTDGSRETLQTASDYIREQGFTFPVFYDTDSDAANTYFVYALPTTYFIDASGLLIASANGAIDGDTLQKGIDMIL